MNAKHTKKTCDKKATKAASRRAYSAAATHYPTASVPRCLSHPSQSVIFFEGDSAEVWWKIFQASGRTENARDYILQNGTFDGDPDSEAEANAGRLY